MLISHASGFFADDLLHRSHAKEALFHDEGKGFILYLSGGAVSSTAEERVVFLELREALI